jgi:hypothetical protein
MKVTPSAKREQSPNAYTMALLTAVLAGLFSIVGGYFVASFQAKHATTQKHLELRAQAYSAFLEKVDRVRFPAAAQILSIGSLADKVGTDGEIQALEDKMEVLLRGNDTQTLYWQLNGDFNLLRLYGTPSIQHHCDDILRIFAEKRVNISWNKYPAPVRQYYEKWRHIEDSDVAYFDPKITTDERLMMIVVARLFASLITELRSELYGQPSITQISRQ